MSRRLTPIVVLLSLSAFGAATTPAASGVLQLAAAQPLVVHEWGTFTSVAGTDGRAVEWRPLDGPVDVPCFVERLGFNVKGSLAAKIRMETPVLYFYAPRETTVNVRVLFRQGVVTEWFPRAAVTPMSVDYSTLRRPDFSSSIAWKDVRISPSVDVARDRPELVERPDAPEPENERFPLDGSGSHYYRARETDASPLHSGSEWEKFLFYRGVGGFEPPIAATVRVDGRIVVEATQGGRLGDVILFENAGGTMSYQVRHSDGGQLVFDAPAHDGSANEEGAPPLAELERILVAHGLYAKEARAMLSTWRDSWFEEGTRLFYVVPDKTIDSILPLEISPEPTEVARLFVGRIELVTSRVKQEVEQALAERDSLTLKKYGRFLQAIADRIKDRRPAS
jgi:hypothetical protein